MTLSTGFNSCYTNQSTFIFFLADSPTLLRTATPSISMRTPLGKPTTAQQTLAGYFPCQKYDPQTSFTFTKLFKSVNKIVTFAMLHIEESAPSTALFKFLMVWWVCHSMSFWSTLPVQGLIGICPDINIMSPTAVTGE